MLPPEIRVTGGLVRGRREAGVEVYRGIPYAAAPVGKFRFAAPQPVAEWDGVRPAESFGSPVPQSAALGHGLVPSGDDWLTVNVWTPATDPGDKLPVLVWIHGGAYTIGGSALAEYDGGPLTRPGGVVLVTFNYRVGAEGFGLFEGAPANRGLLDQVAALEWVAGNIEAFGGDPARVTIFGESAGGGSVAALLAMPNAAGLFRGAIAQSAQGTFFSRELAADIAAAFAEQLDCRPVAADLAALDPADLVAAADRVTAGLPDRIGRWGAPAYKSVVHSPVIDGDSLPATPWAALAAGSGRDVALLAGHTRDEERLFSVFGGRLGQITDEEAARALDLLAPDPARYREAYPQAGPDQLYEIVCSDWTFRMPTVGLADAQLAGGGRAHVYELTWPAPAMGGALGACHGLDVPLVFGNLSDNQPAMLLDQPPSADTIALSEQFRIAWTSFATSGDPGWPAWTADERLTRLFDRPSTVVTYPEQASREIWPSHSFEPLTLGD